MKNSRAILFFLALSLVSGLMLAGLSFGRRPAAEPARPALTTFDARKISRLELERAVTQGGASECIQLARIDGKWRIEQPIAAEADEAAVKRIVDAVLFAEPVDELSSSDMASMGRGLRDFGLAAPGISLVLSSENRREAYEFGRKTPSGDEIYARRNGKDGVFTLPVGVAKELQRPLGDLRRRRLFTIDKAYVVAVGLKNAGGQLSKLVKGRGSWRLTDPMDAPADKTVVDELLEAFCSASVIDYVSPGAGVASGLGDNEGYTVSLVDSFGVVEKIALGASSGTNSVWALTPEGATVHVPSSLAELCKKRQKILEDTRVFPVEKAGVLSLSVTEGFPAYMLSRSAPSEDWRLVSPVDAPADKVAVEGLLTRILALRGVDLASEGAEPTISFSLGTAVTNFPSCTVSASFLPDGFRLSNLRDKLVLRCARTGIRKIKVVTAAGAGWDATRSEWMLECVEKGIVAESVETVVFRAGDFERCGFDRPSFTLSFELDDRDSAMRKLLLGAAAPGGGRYAMIGGVDAAFILSAETVSTLTKPMEEILEKRK